MPAGGGVIRVALGDSATLSDQFEARRVAAEVAADFGLTVVVD